MPSLGDVHIAAYMISCPGREERRGETLAALARTDWGDPVWIETDRSTFPSREERIAHAGLQLLEAALAGGTELILFLEDDLDFNRHLRHNLSCWSPLRRFHPGAHLFGTLYDPGFPRPSSTGALDEAPDAYAAPAEAVYGSQAVVLSRATALYCARHWWEVAGMQDIKLSRLAARVTPLWVHAPSLVQHVGERSTWGGSFHQAAGFSGDFRAVPRHAPPEGTTAPPITVETARSRVDEAIAGLPREPPAAQGTGIVLAAGGLRYLANAWVCISRLRALGCTLPVELWHAGREELTPAQADVFRRLGVACVDATTSCPPSERRALSGWALKSFALARCRFRHVLLLDADNVPTRDPAFLFDTAEYRDDGAIFWPDFGVERPVPTGRLTAAHPAWGLVGVEPRTEREFESGQVCVDKERCFRGLELALWMNVHGDFWYRHLHGDKDTFHLAFRRLGLPYAMPPRGPLDMAGLAMGQYDFDGNLLFQHRACDKWRLDGGNLAIPGFLQEDECRRDLALFREALAQREASERAAIVASLVGRPWVYERVGSDVRILGFGDDGSLLRGASRDLHRWSADEGALLLLTHDGRLARRLRRSSGADRWSDERSGDMVVVKPL